VWDAAKHPVQAPKPILEPLPSDARFREDLQALQVFTEPQAPLPIPSQQPLGHSFTSGAGPKRLYVQGWIDVG
jgi:hypothetical protein